MVKIRCIVRKYNGLNRQSLVQIQVIWIIYSEFLFAKCEYVTFQTYFLSLLVKEKMNKILHIILISFFSLTIISCSKKDDDSSSSSSATTLSPPSDLTAAGAASQVTLDWTAVSGASSYTVYWDNSTGVSSSSTAITSVSTDNYTHSSLDNGTTYYYKVATVDSAGTGTLSSEVNAATPLPAPDNLSASGANNTITLIWNSVSGATSYTLYWDNVSGIDSSDTAITSITNDNYTHNNMDNGSTYYYKVAAVNSSGTGTLSSVASALLSADIQGSQTYNAHTYAITSSAMNHADATAAAASAGGYLVTITTKAENDWLTATFETIYGDIWIGAKDVISEGTWVWDSGKGENFSSSSVWPSDNTTRKFCSNEPNNSGDCAQIYQASGCWDDTICTNTKLGIIEFD